MYMGVIHVESLYNEAPAEPDVTEVPEEDAMHDTAAGIDLYFNDIGLHEPHEREWALNYLADRAEQDQLHGPWRRCHFKGYHVTTICI